MKYRLTDGLLNLNFLKKVRKYEFNGEQSDFDALKIFLAPGNSNIKKTIFVHILKMDNIKHKLKLLGGKMIKKVFLFAIIATFFAACNNAGTTESTEAPGQTTETPEIVMMTTTDFITHPEDFVGKEIVIEGTTVHVCKHGGKRMFIIGDTTDTERIQIKAGDAIDAFKVELEGSEVSVVGVVDELRIDEAYLTQWENELRADKPESELKIHKGEEGHEHDEGDPNAEFKQIDAYRAQLAEQGVDHLSFYSIIAKEYKEKK